MRKIINKLTAFILLSTFLFASLSGEEERHSPLIVEKLEIVVPTQPADVSDHLIQTIQARLKTQPGNFFTQSDFDSDLKMLVQDYDRVEPHVELHDGKIIIQLKIWQNPRIRQIVWDGVDKVKLSTLKKELNILPGSSFNRVAFNKQINKIKAYYIKEGFFEAQVSYDPVYSDQTNEVDIIIHVCEGRAGKIKKIVFCNFTDDEETELLETMITKKYNVILSWLSNEGTYNEEAMQQDRFNILNYLHNKGYADAKVNVEIQETCEQNRIIICISTERGELYTIGNITLDGYCIFTEEDLRSRLKICPGDPFSPERLHAQCERLMNFYGRYGYIESTAAFVPKLRSGERVFDVNFHIDEGEQYYVGLIKVLGNTTTQTSVILHETLLVPGEVFNLEKLKKTEERLVNIGYFSNVNVYAVKSAEDGVLPSNYRDIHIEVEETNTGNLGAFFGFSTSENMFGGINISEKNFNYKGFRNLFSEGYNALRGGGEYAHITLSLGTKSKTYGLSWTKPYFMDTPWSVGFDLEKSDTGFISDDISIKSVGLTLHASYICNAFMKVGPHLRVRYSDIREHEGHHHENQANNANQNSADNNTNQTANESQNNDEKSHPKAGTKRDHQLDNDGLIAAVGMSWVYNSTNHPICPTRGLKSTIEAEVAGFDGIRSFFSIAYLNSYYYNLWGKATLKLRADIKFLQPLRRSTPEGIPLDERFFLGGDYMLRGYRPYRLGPKFDGEVDEPQGGVSMQLFSAEISKTLFSRMDAFIFADCGAISLQPWRFGGYYTALGVGARVKLLEGGPPVTVGIGFPLNYKSKSDVKKFFISLGGKF